MQEVAQQQMSERIGDLFKQCYTKRRAMWESFQYEHNNTTDSFFIGVILQYFTENALLKIHFLVCDVWRWRVSRFHSVAAKLSPIRSRDPKPVQPVVDRQPPPVPLEEAGAGSVARR